MNRSGRGFAERPKTAPGKAPSRLGPPAVQREARGEGQEPVDWGRRLARTMRLGVPGGRDDRILSLIA